MSADTLFKRKEAITEYYKGNYKPLIALLCANVSWVSHKMANVQLQGKEQVLDFLAHVPEGRFTFTLTRMIDTPDHLIAEGVCRYTNPSGKQIENFFCDLFTFDQEGLASVSAYFV